MISPYRTHTCAELNKEHIDTEINLSGWIYRRRDHGGVLFIDLRDHYGITQIVLHPESGLIDQLTHISLESVIAIRGTVVAREDAQINEKLPTGAIEVDVKEVEILSEVEALPWAIADDSIPEELRLKHRYLDLRREKLHAQINLRSDVIASIRKRMWELNFREYQTPILTASSPEGARDFLVPSRLHPGQFYALPQAPQQFKQLLMMSGFDRYFQIAPCFRDEDPRADRTPGEFYQLDMEMSFVTQEDVFKTVETVIGGVFREFANGRKVITGTDTDAFVRIPFDEALLKYGSDKPDLRNPIEVVDVSTIFAQSDFGAFKGVVEKGGVVRAIPAPKASTKPRSWFDKLVGWATKELGAGGLGYITKNEDGSYKGPIAKFLTQAQIDQIFADAKAACGDVVFFMACSKHDIMKFVGPVRNRIGEDLDLLEKDVFKWCWIVDFPIYQRDDETGKIDFEHNPFSMPQGGMDDLLNKDPLDVKGFQYDAVCNGFEMLSGAIRNHKPEIMYKAFEIAGYSKEDVDTRFSGMINAFRYGAPPHGGMALGLDRTVMLLADVPNLREVIAFPMNQRGQDLMMNAPAAVDADQLKELGLKIAIPPKALAVGS